MPDAFHEPATSPTVAHTRKDADAQAPSPAAQPSTDVLADTLRRDLDQAMRRIDAPDRANPARPMQPAIRGPRVVEAGREHRRGTVVSVGPTDVFVEFGPKELGVVPRSQWTGDEPLPAVGDLIELVVDRYEPTESLYLCSRPGAVHKAEWELIQPGQTVEARVTGVNRGGLELDVGGHVAFMPASHVALERVPDLSVFVGEKLTCRVQRVDRRGRGSIVLSRRELLEQERRQQAESLRQSLQIGQVLNGTVRRIAPFGAFVDVGGIDGLVHLTDLSHERIAHGEKHVQRVVRPGQQVRVQVLAFDWEAGRLSLGIKQIQEDPFSTALEQIREGDAVTGRVTRCTEFGAFVEIASGVEGLVHISELSHRRVGKVGDVLHTGQVVSVKVLRIDREARRISLSLKALETPPERTDRSRRREPVEAMPESPALRRLREKFGARKLKGGLG